MESSTSTLTLRPPLPDLQPQRENGAALLFDAHQNLPTQFLWPHEDLPRLAAQVDLDEPPVDLLGFFAGDHASTSAAATRIRSACLSHGFFQVVNHGVDQSVVSAAHQQMDAFFKLPLAKKLSVRRRPGGLCGYSEAHRDRFSIKLPWKETFSFAYNHADAPGVDVLRYFKSALGDDFEEAGRIYQRYCEAMKTLSMAIFELLAISLGIDRSHYRRFFEDGSSIMRGNNYPPCKEAGLTLGTGPHSDPNSLTILHQDEVGGLEIFSDNKWQAIRPCPDAFVVNIGDAFMALSNGIYKSCVHRAVVNKERVRRSLVFFVNPHEDKLVGPHPDLVLPNQPRLYPDFTWSDLRDFTQNHYRADSATLQNFVRWLSHSDT